jgi:hypothetical protein
MKTLILLSLVLFTLAACKKEEKISPNTTPPKSTAVIVAKADTIPDSATLKITLVKDTVNADETMFVFKHTSSLAYVFDEDAPYFQGFGEINLSSISSNGRDLAINGLPYTSGMSIGLDVQAKTNGAYFLEISYERKIPSTIQIWLKDTRLKDSVDLRSHNYNFSVSKADTTSFGRNRFKLVLKGSGQQQTTLAH